MNRSEYTKKLFALGCAYSVRSKQSPVDLEQTILDGLIFFWDSNDLFFMLYGVLHHRIGHLVHIERLIILAKKANLSNDHLILLLCLSKKLYNSGHDNFKSVLKKLKKKNLKFKNPPSSETDSFLIERWGIDPEFKEYGAELRQLPLEKVKKFFTLTKIFENNLWLSLRAVSGSNNRADILYVKTAKIVPTANQAASFLGCSKDAAYRYWKGSKEINNIKLMIN